MRKVPKLPDIPIGWATIAAAIVGLAGLVLGREAAEPKPPPDPTTQATRTIDDIMELGSDYDWQSLVILDKHIKVTINWEQKGRDKWDKHVESLFEIRYKKRKDIDIYPARATNYRKTPTLDGATILKEETAWELRDNGDTMHVTYWELELPGEIGEEQTIQYRTVFDEYGVDIPRSDEYAVINKGNVAKLTLEIIPGVATENWLRLVDGKLGYNVDQLSLNPDSTGVIWRIEASRDLDLYEVFKLVWSYQHMTDPIGYQLSTAAP